MTSEMYGEGGKEIFPFFLLLLVGSWPLKEIKVKGSWEEMTK